jgi:hypothetical protein
MTKFLFAREDWNIFLRFPLNNRVKVLFFLRITKRSLTSI